MPIYVDGTNWIVAEELIDPALGLPNPNQCKGLIFREEQKALRDLAVGRRCLEVGAYKGMSACIMAPNAVSVISVDNFDLTDQIGTTNIDVLPIYRANTKHLRNIMLIIGDSRLVHTIIPNESLELVFIDGDHSYEGCSHDLHNYYPKLRNGGILVAHDYSRRLYPTVAAACQIFFNRLPDGLVGTLAWWGKSNA